jgi:multidrug resistance efflux pump
MTSSEQPTVPDSRRERLGESTHRLPRRALIPIGLIVAGLIYWLATLLAPGLPDNVIPASGTIEAEETLVAAEVAGRVATLLVDEGSAVKAGDVVATLDGTLLKAQSKQSAAALDTARANLAVVKAGSRPEELRAGQAAVAQAVAARDAAELALKNVTRMRDDPQDLKARINAAETGVAAAQARLDQVRYGIRPADLEAARTASAAAKTALTQAEANAKSQQDIAAETLAAAEARLKLMTQGPRAEDLRAAELAVDQSKNLLYSAQTNRDGICGNSRVAQYQCEAANAQVNSAETAVQNAQNALTKLKNGSLPEELRTAEAAVRQAKSNLESIQSTSGPSVAAARQAAQSADARLAQLSAGANAEDIALAQANLEQAKRGLADLIASRDNPLAANAQIDAARGQFDAAKAASEQTAARLDALKAGATAEQLAVAQSMVAQAEAAVALTDAQLARTSLTSPIDGVVAKRSLEVGEYATPGAPVVSIVKPDPLKLTIYVAEPLIGRVGIGQSVTFTVDPYPGQTFSGEVIFIASRAEFTPRNVQTQKDRATTVFAVKVRIPNPDGKLKPGLPADAQIVVE